MPRAERYSVSFAWRLEKDEADRLRQVAAAHGLRPAVWARQVVCAALAIEYKRPPVGRRILHADLLGRFLGELQQQGDCLDRIARNAAATPRDGMARELVEIREQHLRLMTGVLDALGADPKP